MHRRQLLVGAGALALAVGSNGLARASQMATPPGPEDARLKALFDAFFQAAVDESPERATSLGLDKGARAAMKFKLDDRSAEARTVRLRAAKARLDQLHTIDKSRLSQESAVDYEVIDYQLTGQVEGGSRFNFGSSGGRYSPYVISQQNGAYQDVPDFLDNAHKIETAADCDAYLSRLKAFSVALDQDLERANADAGRGVIPPDFIIDTTLGQLKALRGAAPAESGLVTSLTSRAAKAKLTGDYGPAAAAIVEHEIYPALDRQIGGMQALRAKATGDAGVWKLPDGESYYAHGLEASTTTKLTPAQVHQMGLDQVKEITARIDTLLIKQGKSKGTVAERLTAMNDEPDQLYPNTDEGRVALIDQLNTQIGVIYEKLPQAFNTLPKAKVQVKRVPPNVQDGKANGYYVTGPLDGSLPATYYINLKDTHDWPKYGLPTLTYHESVPGHHLQISLMRENPNVPLIRRAGGGFSAFSEGWALYAEQLAWEMGLYKGDVYGEIGFLQSFLFRACRLVVDTGIHYKKWSRAQATDYMIGVTGYARGRTQREIDRYCVSPGQACSYKVGHTMWVKVRDNAKAKLGKAFDLKNFHDAVLLPGTMPLTVLEAQVDRWIQSHVA
ncbi:MAG: hypothetical protein JWP35_531 [Caulobacter sp.]|nr:hypothetical protein [Caulobacter sp.]